MKSHKRRVAEGLERDLLRCPSDDEVADAIRSVPTHHFGPQGVDFASATVAAKGRGPSRVIWGNFNYANVAMNPDLGFGAYEEFASFGGVAPASKIAYYPSAALGSWKSYEETSGSIKQLNLLPTSSTIPNTQRLGVVELATAASVSNTIALEAGGGNGGSFGLTGNVMPALFFEACVAVNLATVSGLDTFVGLCEKGGAASQFLITSGDALNQKSFIGFWSLTAAATTINAGYGKNGSAATIPTVSTGAVYTKTASSVQQFTKLGFVYDPRQPAPVLKFYQDGTLISSVTDATATGFPTGVALTPTLILQSDASAAAVVKLDFDWVAVGMLFQ